MSEYTDDLKQVFNPESSELEKENALLKFKVKNYQELVDKLRAEISSLKFELYKNKNVDGSN